MTRTHRFIARRILLFAFTASVMIGAPHGQRTVPFGRSAPCAACGHATPVAVDCDGLTWHVYNPGTIADAAASVCPPGSTYTWKAIT